MRTVEDLITVLDSDQFQENFLQLLFAVPAIYIFVKSFDFAFEARLFPQLTSGIVLLFIALIKLEDRLPEWIQPSESGGIMGFDDEDLGEEISREETEPEGRVYDTSNMHWIARHGGIFTALLTLLYIVTGLAVGLMWVTPPFVFAYCYLRGQSWRTIIILTVLSAGIAYGFMDVARAPIEEGWLT